jgi:ABC-type antimicrobial peptide transport system permease subunit
MEQRIATSTRGRRFSMRLLVGYAVVALFLAGLGVYSTMAHAVRQRRKEIGIRLTVGAEERHVRGMILRDGLRTVALGLAFGLAGAALLMRVAASLLYAVEPFDTSVLVIVAALLGATAALACYFPARYASTQDVVTSLRA